ncbi:MAG TPA: ATP-binding protein [Terriglobia bacterium]|nr:ATP-binding protein [Terriglobia bacterium]
MAHGNSAAAPALIILSGLPGTGKTTFAHALLAGVPAAHIESDAIRRGLAPVPRYTSNENAAVFGRVEAAARTALTGGRHAILDATNLTTRDRRRFVRLARELDARVIFVRLTAPEDVVKGRLAHPRAGFSQAAGDTYDRMRDRPQRFAGPAIVVDTRFVIGPSVALVAKLALTWAEPM